jgi:NAD(P)-dependent dehydrogenase (short-subunit alcohol dehydrogenase family)
VTAAPGFPDLAGKAVLVTGGATGIGAALVAGFAAQGARAAFLDVDRAAGEALAARTGARFVPCDVTDVAALQEAVRSCGPLDVLVNNAARDDRHAFAHVTPERWRALLAVNLDHHVFATQAAAPAMPPGASVILMGSVSWVRGRPGLVAYTTAKAGIHGLVRTLARELGPAGIRVNGLVPGAILTERQRALWRTPDEDRAFLERQAIPVLLDAQHLVGPALFLASEASAGMTGTEIRVDAGLTLG